MRVFEIFLEYFMTNYFYKFLEFFFNLPNQHCDCESEIH